MRRDKGGVGSCRLMKVREDGRQFIAASPIDSQSAPARGGLLAYAGDEVEEVEWGVAAINHGIVGFGLRAFLPVSN